MMMNQNLRTRKTSIISSPRTILPRLLDEKKNMRSREGKNKTIWFDAIYYISSLHYRAICVFSILMILGSSIIVMCISTPFSDLKKKIQIGFCDYCCSWFRFFQREWEKKRITSRTTATTVPALCTYLTQLYWIMLPAGNIFFFLPPLIYFIQFSECEKYSIYHITEQHWHGKDKIWGLRRENAMLSFIFRFFGCRQQFPRKLRKNIDEKLIKDKYIFPRKNLIGNVLFFLSHFRNKWEKLVIISRESELRNKLSAIKKN